MYTYTNFKLMRSNLSLMRGLRAKLGINPTSTRNDAAGQIWRTSGDATLAAFGVAPRRRSTTTSTSSLREIGSRSQSSIMKLA